ncbi:hypothetical protein [Agromyces sp. Soil535]|uniref:hypothetical protein n=1 Tax=Agromyces sp. Soil535 TaxID=1736390 RepID=UPI0006FC8814|nr:hypothetical protein [Agromyces sp. Soil535]KRE30442.1 hypothetical protein ASG80_16945 [Agromyces sp. Soil535]
MLNNREIATLILIGAGIVLVLAIPTVRRAVLGAGADVMRTASSPKVLAVFGLFLAWCTASIVIAWRIGLWNVDLLKDSVLIVLTVGFPVLLTVVKAKSGGAILRKIIGETVALSTLLAFYLNLEPFSLLVEVILQLALFVLIVMIAWAGLDPGRTKLAGRLGLLLIFIVCAIGVWTTVRLVVTANERDWSTTWMELALSIWLPLSMFGYFYGVAFFAYVETANLRMRRIFQPPARKRVMVAVVLGLHLRVRWAAAFTGPFQNRVSRSPTFREALAAMRAFRQEVLDREAREQERQARLTVMAGEPGTDGDGAQLDRREFEGTKRALRYMIHTAQEMRYERLGNRYWDDLTEKVIQPAFRYGLPDSHGILVEVTADHQKWRAWRRLPSGWVLGVGGRDGSRREFLYSGAEPPTTWPGAPDWADTAVPLQLPADWEQDDSPVK